MPISQTLPTTTIIQTNASDISIRTQYFSLLPNTLRAEIKDNAGTSDNVSFNQGDLLIIQKNHPDQIFYTMNSVGELIVHTTTNDHTQYSIDANGDLIYTT